MSIYGPNFTIESTKNKNTDPFEKKTFIGKISSDETRTTVILFNDSELPILVFWHDYF